MRGWPRAGRVVTLVHVLPRRGVMLPVSVHLVGGVADHAAGRGMDRGLRGPTPRGAGSRDGPHAASLSRSNAVSAYAAIRLHRRARWSLPQWALVSIIVATLAVGLNVAPRMARSARVGGAAARASHRHGSCRAGGARAAACVATTISRCRVSRTSPSSFPPCASSPVSGRRHAAGATVHRGRSGSRTTSRRSSSPPKRAVPGRDDERPLTARSVWRGSATDAHRSAAGKAKGTGSSR
jgi:hypothetical protein